MWWRGAWGVFIRSFIPYFESAWSLLCLLALLLWEILKYCSPTVVLHVIHDFLRFYHVVQFPLSRLRFQLHELFSQSCFLPLFILTAFPFFTVVLCIFEKFMMRSLCSMWHTSILFCLLLFLTLPHITKTRPVLSEQVLLLLQCFGSYSSAQRVGVQIPRTLVLDARGKDD